MTDPKNVITWVDAKGKPVEVRCRFCKGPVVTLREAAGKISRCEKDGVLSKRDIELVNDPLQYSSATRRRMTQ